MTFDKLIYNIPAYQEGNEADWEFELDINFPIAQVSDLSLQIRDAVGKLIMPEKKLSTGSISLAGYLITIPFSASEMKGKPGVHKYELDFLNIAGHPFATIGGTFTISPEINKQ